MINVTDYVPVLKWRQGEYQALWRLDDAQKARIVPLIEVTPPDFDFEQWQPKKTIDGHLKKFAARFKQKWGERPALLDAGLLDPAARMIGGTHPLLWLVDQVRLSLDSAQQTLGRLPSTVSFHPSQTFKLRHCRILGVTQLTRPGRVTPVANLG